MLFQASLVKTLRFPAADYLFGDGPSRKQLLGFAGRLQQPETSSAF